MTQELFIPIRAIDFFALNAFPTFVSRHDYTLSEEDVFETITSSDGKKLLLDDWCILTTYCFMCHKEDYLFSTIKTLMSVANSHQKIKYQTIINSFFNTYTVFLLAVFINDDFDRYLSFFQRHFHYRSSNDFSTPSSRLPLFLKCNFITADELLSNVLPIHKFLITQIVNNDNQNPLSDELQSILEYPLLLLKTSFTSPLSITKMVEVFSLCPRGLENAYTSSINLYFSQIFHSYGSLHLNKISDIFIELFSNPRLSSIAFKENYKNLLIFCDIENDMKEHPDLFV